MGAPGGRRPDLARSEPRRLDEPAAALPRGRDREPAWRLTQMATGTGTRDDPWQLTTPPGTSAYQMWRDDTAEPAVIVCQVGGTQLKYDARAIDELHAWLREQGDWVSLGGADEQKPAPEGSV